MDQVWTGFEPSPKGRLCIIFGAAPMEKTEILYEEGCLVLCADGGVKNALKCGITPHYLVTDGDSGGNDAGLCPAVLLPAEKDDTDTMACVRLGLEQGCARFLLYGCTGGRLDHFIANLSLLRFMRNNGADGLIVDRQNRILLLPGKRTLTVEKNNGYRYLSVFPAAARSEGVFERGVKYPLEDAVLTADYPIGISNEITADRAEIGCRAGDLLVCFSNDLVSQAIEA